ncbi:hypothetical protein [Sinomonas atrocyanea]|uniref:hypothetical protein n=1 Tax=Sinomonas atrocyanea TaxID=37927 RepID=UPI0027800255|nr:hypothetical protein [Sinomonas atrocyanea]MDQ0261014.1 hypothetical protein [Sinomonas atrocyanea]MDR6622031.1 hypothetical protein [Sinomonas atrocyanea]
MAEQATDVQTGAWESILAAFESDLAAAERLLGGPLPGEHDAGRPARAGLPPAVVRWAAPERFGPLPEHLAERARALEAAQQDLAGRLAEARSNAATHLGALRAVPSARRDAPVYLDVQG